MTRNEKIKKLGNAIKRLRGLRNPSTDKWVQPPNPAAADDCVRWLQKLREPFLCTTSLKKQLAEDMQAILNFKTLAEYDDWIKTL